ncbi:MAG: carbohydrate ABC transporter permease [Candidatus Sumerlaeota bacterium]|nr:carbohydrate ABC transporter permease [Candidatus Sumerlaeota bacterium]
MPIISRIGSRNWKVRLLYAAMYAVLLLGAATMIYPFLIMLAGSVKSEADSMDVRPYPEYWFDDLVLFQKYVESKYNVLIDRVEQAWGRPVGSWQAIQPPAPEESTYLAEFLEWRPQCRWWFLGHTTGGRLFPINARLFRDRLRQRYRGDLDRLDRELAVPIRSWFAVQPLPERQLRFPDQRTGYAGAFWEFAESRPIEDRMILNLDGRYWKTFLVPRYSSSIDTYNEKHQTRYADYQEIHLARQAPENELERRDWEEFVRGEMRLDCIRLDLSLADAYRAALSRQYSDIASYNDKHGASHRSFDDISFPTEAPASPLDQADWDLFIRDREACPIEGISVFGPRQAFEEFLAARRGVPSETVEPVALPIAAADYHDAMAHKSELRREFTFRNYLLVLQYVLLHGRGFLNTVIYCVLAIGAALVVNPLAAYALSRYNPPSAYKILLFCMGTMAFPGEVTMIPAFLLMKRFPLWPLLGAGAAFGAILWSLANWARRWPEALRMTLALGGAIAVGAWAVPALSEGHSTVSLLNTFAALVLPSMANGFSIFLLKGFFDSLPRELYESAEIDGAGEWTKFWAIAMSLSKPILAVIALQAFIQAYSAFMMALIIIPDQKMWTLMVWLYQLQSTSHQAIVYASLVVAAVPTFIVFALCQNVIMRGIVVPVEK